MPLLLQDRKEPLTNSVGGRGGGVPGGLGSGGEGADAEPSGRWCAEQLASAARNTHAFSRHPKRRLAMSSTHLLTLTLTPLLPARRSKTETIRGCQGARAQVGMMFSATLPRWCSAAAALVPGAPRHCSSRPSVWAFVLHVGPTAATCSSSSPSWRGCGGKDVRRASAVLDSDSIPASRIPDRASSG